jgi:acyl-coenzyme A synthetase/AMP-(fatty) acid ligase
MYDTGDLACRDEAGILHFVGRADSQIKINGYRVELGEIESVIAAHPQVDEAAVVCLGGARPSLVAMVSWHEGAGDEAAGDVLAHCRRMLPAYMVPARLTARRDLPRNDNGKIDRAAVQRLIEGGDDRPAAGRSRGTGAPTAASAAEEHPQ